MSNTNTSIEDWNVYRKLVVDTLRRLDERTTELHNNFTEARSDIVLLKNRIAVMDTIEDNLANIRADIGKINTERNTEKTLRKVFLIIGGGVWTVITIALSAAIRIVWG